MELLFFIEAAFVKKFAYFPGAYLATNVPVSRAAKGAFVSQGAARRRLEWLVGVPLVPVFSNAKGA